MQTKIPAMTRDSAIRAARTATTNAENAGRQDGFIAAEEMGIQVKKRWVATKDMRTRHEHGMADGQVVPADQPFEVGGEKLMFPADTAGSPWNVYNCRCAMRTVEKEGIEAEPRKIRVRDPVTGKNVVVNDMTYSEWLKWKEGQEKEAGIGKSAENSKKNIGMMKTTTASKEKDDKTLISSGKYSTIQIGKSLGAKAKNYDVVLPNNEIVHLTEGTRVTNVTVIGGKGRTRNIDQAPVLVTRYPGTVESEWKKVKGIGYVDYQGESYKADLHWYEEPSVGRVEWKVKPDADGNWFIEDD